MPAQYEAIKRSLSSKYKSDEMRKKHAAMIYNALRRKQGKPGLSPHREGGK